MSVSSTSNGSDSPLTRANTAEREADRRIATAQQRVQQANQDSEQALNQIRDSYEKQSSVASARNTDKIESERNKGYEQIRDLQRNQQVELRKMRRDGERSAAQLREYYRDQTHAQEMNGSQQLHETQVQANRRIEYEKSGQDAQLEEIHRKHEHQVGHLQHSTEEKVTALKEENRRKYDEMRTVSEEENERLQKGFVEKFQKNVTDQAEILDRIKGQASKQIHEIRENTAFKLSAYNSRQSDPFYKLVNINARFYDEGESFVLKAIVPEYEQQHIAATVKGNNLVVSGYRRNEETLNLGKGHETGTASFQSFHETFPLSWPVDAKRLSRVFEGDTLTIRVPKKNEYVYQTPKIGKPEKVRAEPPRFPGNIRQPQQENAKDTDGAEPKPTPKRPGSGTLS
jgi:HSP20 family molecular chaperone IbpA